MHVKYPFPCSYFSHILRGSVKNLRSFKRVATNEQNNQTEDNKHDKMRGPAL